MALLKLTSEEIKLRGSLLSNNKELLQLHRTLVRGGLLSEEEFWETRQGLLQSQETLLRQKKPSTTLLYDSLNSGKRPLLPPPLEGDHKIVLTLETIRAILSQSPSLSKAYRENVPQKLSEKEFWTLYVQSRFFDSTLKANPNNPLSQYYEEGLLANDADRVKAEMDDEINRFGQEKVSRLLDIVATSEDHQSDFNNRTLQLLKTQDGNESLSLIRKFNTSSLKAVQMMNIALINRPVSMSIEEATELKDLKIVEGPKTTPLQVKEPLAASANTSKASMSVDQQEELNEFVNFLLQVKLDPTTFLQNDTILPYQQRNELISELARGNLEDSVSSSIGKPVITEISNEIKIFHSNSLEVLKHFWNSYPAGKDPSQQAKLTRMATILEQLYIKGKELIASRLTLNDQIFTENAICLTLESIDYAVKTYNEQSKTTITRSLG